MIKIVLFFASFIFYFASSVFGQCEVSSIKIDDRVVRVAMSEKVYRNDDLENGLKSVYLHVNTYKDVKSGEILNRDLVITFACTGSQRLITPGQIVLVFSNGASFDIKAKDKSTGTVNQVRTTPADIRTIEGVFVLSAGDVSIIKGRELSMIKIYDLREGGGFDVPIRFRGILNEMIGCTSR